VQLRPYFPFVDAFRRQLPIEAWTVAYWYLDELGRHDPARTLASCDVIALTGEFTAADVGALLGLGRPLIVIGETADAALRSVDGPCVQIVANVRLAYQQAAEHLLAQGYSRPALLLPTDHESNELKAAGMRDALKRHGRDPRDCQVHLAGVSVRGVVAHAGSGERMRRAAAELFAQPRSFDALISAEPLETIAEMVGRQLGFAGAPGLICEGGEEAGILERLSITQLGGHLEQTMHTAARVLLERTAGGWAGYESIAVVPHLTVRRSTRGADGAAP
jgi:DNA-binding LacI/PurR family transcriptional regulator